MVPNAGHAMRTISSKTTIHDCPTQKPQYPMTGSHTKPNTPRHQARLQTVKYMLQRVKITVLNACCCMCQLGLAMCIQTVMVRRLENTGLREDQDIH